MKLHTVFYKIIIFYFFYFKYFTYPVRSVLVAAWPGFGSRQMECVVMQATLSAIAYNSEFSNFIFKMLYSVFKVLFMHKSTMSISICVASNQT